MLGFKVSAMRTSAIRLASALRVIRKRQSSHTVDKPGARFPLKMSGTKAYPAVTRLVENHRWREDESRGILPLNYHSN